MYIAYMTSRGSSCINLLDLNCQWLDISKSHILVYCLFGYLRYQCRSVELDTAELSGMLYKSSGSLFYDNCQVKFGRCRVCKYPVWSLSQGFYYSGFE